VFAPLHATEKLPLFVLELDFGDNSLGLQAGESLDLLGDAVCLGRWKRLSRTHHPVAVLLRRLIDPPICPVRLKWGSSGIQALTCPNKSVREAERPLRLALSGGVREKMRERRETSSEPSFVLVSGG
jgi:hypothetical protein